MINHILIILFLSTMLNTEISLRPHPTQSTIDELVFASAVGPSIRTIQSDRTGMKTIWIGKKDDYPASPSWSSDGLEIMFSVSHPKTLSPTEIHIITVVSGSELVIPLKDSTISASPKWSPDDRSIIFLSNQNGCARTHIIHADGTYDRDVLPYEDCTSSLSPEHYDARWSPNGRYIGFTSLSGQETSIVFVDSLTFEVYAQTPTTTGVFGVSYGFDWSIDSLFAVYPSSSDRHLCLYQLPLKKETCFTNIKNVVHPLFSPKLDSIITSINCVNNCSISIINLDGSISKTLTVASSNVFQTTIQWTLDGRELVFYADDLVTLSIFVFDFTNSNIKEITSQGYDPAWRP